MTFDYDLKPGVVTTANALQAALMKVTIAADRDWRPLEAHFSRLLQAERRLMSRASAMSCSDVRSAGARRAVW
jgi:hypothetical protein